MDGSHHIGSLTEAGAALDRAPGDKANAPLPYLDQEGRTVRELPEGLSDPADLIPLYRTMTLTRAFDGKAIALQRTGRLGTYPSCLGQEAVGAGVAWAMLPDDVLLPSYREQAAQLARGRSPSSRASWPPWPWPSSAT
jgi:TPP-dependent pyruvate/acetoin dehydrogenase alpha subunit